MKRKKEARQNDVMMSQEKEHVAHLDDSSDTNAVVKTLKLGRHIKYKRENTSFCTEYIQFRGQQLPKKYASSFTTNKYRKGLGEDEFVMSQRLAMSKELAQSEDRRMMPVLIVNLDGMLGYWDEMKRSHYVLRSKVVDSMISLSYDFRLVAISTQSQKLMFKLIYGLMNIQSTSDSDSSTRHLIFDAVY